MLFLFCFPDSWYRNELSTAVLHLQESGMLTKLQTKWWKESSGGGACDVSSLLPIIIHILFGWRPKSLTQNPDSPKSRHVKFWLNFDILLTFLIFAKLYIYYLYVFDYINLIKTKSTYQISK